jgi:hypothetical protein
MGPRVTVSRPARSHSPGTSNKLSTVMYARSKSTLSAVPPTVEKLRARRKTVTPGATEPV